MVIHKKLVTFNLMEGVFYVVHLYMRKILCYDTPNLSTQYPS